VILEFYFDPSRAIAFLLKKEKHTNDTKERWADATAD
jgi:hypothetical protein